MSSGLARVMGTAGDSNFAAAVNLLPNDGAIVVEHGGGRLQPYQPGLALYIAGIAGMFGFALDDSALAGVALFAGVGLQTAGSYMSANHDDELSTVRFRYSNGAVADTEFVQAPTRYNRGHVLGMSHGIFGVLGILAAARGPEDGEGLDPLLGITYGVTQLAIGTYYLVRHLGRE